MPRIELSTFADIAIHSSVRGQGRPRFLAQIDVGELGVCLQSASHGGHPDPGSSRAPQDSRTLRCGCSGSKHVVHEENLLTCDRIGALNAESPAQILTALVARKPDLRLRVPRAFE